MAHMSEQRGVYRFLLGKPEGRNRWGDLSVDGWIILEWICRRWDVGLWTGLGWSKIETGCGRCGCSNEPSGSVKCGEFLD